MRAAQLPIKGMSVAIREKLPAVIVARMAAQK
jgi:hypothetical protein